MYLRKFIKLLFCICFLLSNISICFAKPVISDANIDLGDVIQYGNSSTIIITKEGNVTTEGIFNQITNVDNKIIFNDDSSLDGYIDVMSLSTSIPDQTFDRSGCTITISNIVPNNTNSVSLIYGSSGSYSLGFNVVFSGTCTPDKYSITIKIPYNSCSYFLFGSCTPANNGLEANINFSFTITEPLEVVEIKPLNFGSIAILSGGGTLTVSPDGKTSKTGNIVPTSNSEVSAGEFRITGIGSRYVNIILSPSTTINCTNCSGSGPTSMVVESITPNNNTIQLWGYTQDYEATENFYVGATLKVNSNQLQGSYTGKYDVEVIYTDQ